MAERPASTSNLPAFTTSFIGRAVEMAELQEELKAAHLVTLTGTPGCGKTRLALEAAIRLGLRYPDGKWWCDLAAFADPAHVPLSVVTALHLSEDPSRPPLDTLAEAFGSEHALLILDNCEHVLSACGVLAQSLLARCPGLTILATSLQPLGLPQEKVLTVPPLPIPEPSETSIHESESVLLFVDRAGRALPSFVLTPQISPVVATICRRLDGLPLALELAAARVRMLTVEQISERLDDALALLTRSDFDSTPRHRTLRATLDWTYSLLTETERAMLRHLSVFARSFALASVEAVFVDDGVASDTSSTGSAPRVSPLDLLSSLVDKSLVQPLPRDGQPVALYRLPEVIRQYARAKLESAGEAAAARTRHLAWATELAEKADAAWVGPDRAAWLDRLELDHDEIRAALRWARTSRQGTAAFKLAKVTWRLWFTHGHWSEGRGWCEELLALDTELGLKAPPALRADILYRAGTFAYRHHDFAAAARYLEESVALYRTASPNEVAGSLNVLAMIAQLQGDRQRAVQRYEEALAINRDYDDRWGIGIILVNMGGCLREQGEYALAAQCFEEMAPFGDLADLASHAAGQKGALAAAQGDFDRSRSLLEGALRQFEQLGDRDSQTEALEELGRLAINHQRWSLAERSMIESLQTAEAIASSFRIAYAEIGLAHIAREKGQFDRANDLYSQSLKRTEALEDSFGIGLALQGRGLVEMARRQPTKAIERLKEALRYLSTAGRPPEIIAAMEDLGAALAAAGQALLAGRLITATAAWRSAHESPIPPLGRSRREVTVKTVHDALGDESFRQLQDDAVSLTWQAALAEASRSDPVTPEGEVPQPATRLRVFALGPARVFTGERALASPDWKYLKARELFFYLLTVSPATKEQIGLDLWPDASPSGLRSAFHRSLHHMRRALGDADWVRFDREVYHLDDSLGLWYDVREFEALLGQARLALASSATSSARSQAARMLKDALALYAGDFLADVESGEWAIFPREELRRRSLEARLTLGEILFTDARYAEAADTYRRLIALDPYLEGAHRELMRCLARLGETSQAVQHYKGLIRTLRDELNSVPAPETTLLYQRLRRGDDV